MVRTLCIVWYCVDFFHRFSFVLSLSFLRLSIGEFIFSLFLCVLLPVCLLFHFPASDSVHAWLVHTALFYIDSVFSVLLGFKVFHHPQFITPTKEQQQKMKNSLFASSLFNVSSIFSYKILQTNQLNTAFEYFFLSFHRQKRESWTKIACVFFTSHYFHSSLLLLPSPPENNRANLFISIRAHTHTERWRPEKREWVNRRWSEKEHTLKTFPLHRFSLRLHSECHWMCPRVWVCVMICSFLFCFHFRW